MTGNDDGSSNTKEFARAAVEAEFRKKKKRKRGGGVGYGSSSDEDDGDKNSSQQHKKGGHKKRSKGEGGDDDDDDDYKKEQKAIQADLASRYRDRAAERREGKVGGDDEDEDDDEPGEGSKKTSSSSMKWIIPHNKKGLDLSLARQARQKIKQEKQSRVVGPSDIDSFAVERGASASERAMESAGIHVLQEFVSSSPSLDHPTTSTGSTTNNHNNTIFRNRGMMDYLKLIVSYAAEEKVEEGKTDERSSSSTGTTSKATAKSKVVFDRIYDSVEFNAAGRTLQQTQWIMALDGHPSDTRKAWHIPRREIQSSSSSSFLPSADTTTSRSTMEISSNVLDQVDRIFRFRNRILKDMKQTKQQQPQQHPQKKKSSTGSNKNNKPNNNQSSSTVESDKSDNDDNNNDDDDDDDDIFGGLDDYVPPSATAADDSD